MQVLGEDVHALGQLAKPHVGDVARDGGLRADKAEGVELLDERALGLDGLLAYDLPDGVLSVEALLHVAAFRADILLLRINRNGMHISTVSCVIFAINRFFKQFCDIFLLALGPGQGRGPLSHATSCEPKPGAR